MPLPISFCDCSRFLDSLLPPPSCPFRDYLFRFLLPMTLVQTRVPAVDSLFTFVTFPVVLMTDSLDV